METINTDAVVNHRVDIDHILPEEDTGDSSYANLILAHNECNAAKGKRPPFAAFGGSTKWPQITAFLEQTPTMKFKRWRFLLDDEQYATYLKNKGFLSRFSSDTSYISRAAREYLSCLYIKLINEKGFPVTTIKGGQTAVLRKAWGIQRIGYELGALHDSADESETLNKKSRLDHRHHALDAIAVAYSSPAYTHYINSLHAKGIPLSYIQNRIPAPYSLREQMQSEEKEVTLYNEFFYLQIRDVIKNHAHISIKYDTDKNGEILKGTSYNILFADGNNLVFLAKKKIVSIMPKAGFLDIEKTLASKMFTGKNYERLSEEVQNLVKKYVEYNSKKLGTVNEKREIAHADIETQNQQLLQDGKRTRAITDFAILRRALELTGGYYYQLSNKSRDKVFVMREPTEEFRGFAYDTGENLCIDFYHDNKGILKGEIIRKIYAMKNDFIPEYKKEGYKLFERVYQGDTLEIDAYNKNLLTNKSTGLERLATIITPNSVAKRVFVKVSTFTEIGKSINIWVKNIATATKIDGSFNINSMQNWNVRKVQLSSLGFVTYVSSVFKNRDLADT